LCNRKGACDAQERRRADPQGTHRKYSAEEKIRIVLEGLRGEIPISELCRREGIAPTMYYRWSKTFLEAGKNGLTSSGITVRARNR
jgi:transposase